MSEDTAELVIQLLQETRTDVKSTNAVVHRLEQRMAALEAKEPAQTSALSAKQQGGLAAGVAAAVVAVLQVLQLMGVMPK